MTADADKHEDTFEVFRATADEERAYQRGYEDGVRAGRSHLGNDQPD